MKIKWVLPVGFVIIWNLTIQAQPKLNTKTLTLEGDIASRLVEGVDKFLLNELSTSVNKREAYWSRDFSSHKDYIKSIKPNRDRLAHVLGLRDQRIAFNGLSFESTTDTPPLVGKTDQINIYAVSWPAFGDVNGTGLLLEPTQSESKVIANICLLYTSPSPRD